MPFDSNRHHRRSIRLRGYDYASCGAYFVTLVTHKRELLFDDPVLHRVAETFWERIPRHAPHVSLDEWIVMPNHVHGILVIETSVNSDPSSSGPAAGSLGAVVGNFKSVTARRINRIRKTPGAPVWQRNYYDRIVRNERELQAIRQTIADNPRNWEMDREHPNAIPRATS